MSIIKISTIKTPSTDSLSKYGLLIHGPGGVGKSSFAVSLNIWLESQSLPPAYYLDMDVQEGLIAHELYKSRPTDLDEYESLVAQLVKSKDFSYVVVDPINELYNFIFENECRKAGVTHPVEKGDFSRMIWHKISTQLTSHIKDIMRSGKGFIATCKSITSEQSISGKQITRWIPDFGGRAYSIIDSAFPLIGFMSFQTTYKVSPGKSSEKVTDLMESERRVILFNPSQYWSAKSRSSKLGREPIVLSENWQEDWEILTKYWNGETKQGGGVKEVKK